ncbi:MAG: hypothetical protein AAF491_07615 [Verrucomicrobiota bacterium]
MKYTKANYETLWDQSRQHAPNGEPSPLGFETRLRAAMAGAVPNGLEEMGRFSWRFTLASVPVLIFVAVLIGTQNPGYLPEGIGGVVSQWSALLPLELL